MTLFKPYKITKAELDNLSIKEGQFILCTDTKEIYLDKSDTERIQLDNNIDIDKLAFTDINNNFTAAQTINGTLTINGDIVQNGEAYETHAEKLYTKKDEIITRENAAGGLAEGELTGIRASKYDGENDGQLGFDATGTARVGDVGDTQPLLTRAETTDLSNGQVLVWDSENEKAIGSSSYVKNTDYAGSNAGIIKADGTNAINVNSAHALSAETRDYNNYNNSENSLFIGKGTLENVITGKELVNKTYVDKIKTDLSPEEKGKEISVNALESNAKDIDIDGNSYQYTTEGKQLITKKGFSTPKDDTDFYKSFSDNCFTPLEDGWGRLQSDGTTGIRWANSWINASAINIQPSTQYTLFTEIRNKTGTGCIRTSGSKLHIFTTNQSYDNNGIYKELVTTVDDLTNKCLRFFSDFGSTTGVGNIEYRAMILEGDHTSEDLVYEPYTGGTASPNPDYPQEIEVVDNGHNLFDKDNIIDVQYKILNDSGTEVDDTTGAYTKMYIPVKPNAAYTISGMETGGTKRIYFFDKSKSFISRSAGFSNNYLTFTTPSNCYYIDVQYYLKNIDFSNYMITEGTEQKTYLPYGHIGIKQSGKNLAKIVDGTFSHSDSGSIWNITNGVIHATKTNTSYQGGAITLATGETRQWANQNSNNYDTTKPGAYTISVELKGTANSLDDSNGGIILFYTIFNSDGTKNSDSLYMYVTKTLMTVNKTITKTVTLTEGQTLSSLSLYSQYLAFDLEIKIQLEEGTISTSYEPYHEPVIHDIDLNGNELCKIGDVKDELDITTSVLTKRIGKMILDGSEGWKIQNNGKCFMLYKDYFTESNKPKIIPISDIGPIICNYFKANSASKTWTGNEGISYDNEATINISCTSIATDVDTFKTWLSTHPVTVYYVLATPQTIQLTPTQVKLWDGTNKLNLITNLETDFSVEYYKSNEMADSIMKEVLEIKSSADDFQTIENLTTELTESSTDAQYPSAKTVFDALKNAGGGAGIHVGPDAPTDSSEVWIDTDEDGNSASGMYVGADEPTDPAIEVWIDTDEEPTAIPTKTSDLTNDSGFITSSSVPTKTSSLTNDSGFITSTSITNIWIGTQEQYDAITTKSSTTMYYIKED